MKSGTVLENNIGKLRAISTSRNKILVSREKEPRVNVFSGKFIYFL